ncbi:MAG: hypothetical protein NTX97_11765 [Bacteroidetes bacterium]|nr:hypothetical protein [Bacteroidota bacterium]
MKKILSLVLILFSFYGFACECPPSSPISKELCQNYDVIFYGMVDSVTPCNSKGFSTAFFTITELYKGNAEKNVKIDFDCSSACMMSFSKGEEWLIYSKYVKFDQLKVTFCEHSRKKYNDDSQDVFLIAAQRTFEKEKEFLKTTFGLQYFIHGNDINKQENEIGPRNDQPSAYGKLILLLVSVSAMGIVYYVTRKK